MSTTNPPTTNEAWSTLFTSVKSSLPSTPQSYKPTTSPEHTASTIASTIDHTLLAPNATTEQITTLCTEASTHNFATVCVRLPHVSHAVGLLKSHTPPVGVACVIGFHEGTYPTASKVAEATSAVSAGASELDMVLNRTHLQSGDYVSVYEDILAVRKAAGESVKLKVILETGRLESDDEVIAGCVISCLAGADFVKTSTGFDGPGATVEAVGLMRRVADAVSGGKVKVKASGGVRTAEDAIKMVETGAGRIGASAGVKIVKEMEGKGSDEKKGDSGGY